MSERQQILMCPPDHFEVDYVINPWMEGKPGAVDLDLATAQWRALRDAVAAYADIIEMPAVEGLPDIVFTANAGIVVGDLAIPARFHHDERRGEEPHFTRVFRERGFRVAELPDDIRHEGAGDALIHRGEPWLWVGYGQRSEQAALDFIDQQVDLELLGLRLVDPRYYHIDTCFCPLTGGFLMYFPQAFDAETLDRIHQRVPTDKRIAVGAADAERFACNAVNIEDQVFVNDASVELEGALNAAGLMVNRCDLSEFIKAGGSAKCLSLKLVEPAG
jgi:N-dimethylarginine dimethylaminohydrolase